MAIGDDAKAAGFDTVLDSDDSADGYQEINRSRDYIARTRKNMIWNDSSSYRIALRWDAATSRIIPNIDNYWDQGGIVFTRDLAQRDTLIGQLAARIAALEAKTASMPVPPTSEGGNAGA